MTQLSTLDIVDPVHACVTLCTAVRWSSESGASDDVRRRLTVCLQGPVLQFIDDTFDESVIRNGCPEKVFPVASPFLYINVALVGVAALGLDGARLSNRSGLKVLKRVVL